MVRLNKHPDFPDCFRLGAVFAALLFACALQSSANAQDASQRPPHASEVVGELERARWQPLERGLNVMRVATALGTRVTAISIDLDAYRFAILPQEREKGERAGRVLQRSDAALVINGGFFAMTDDDALRPVGRLIIDGEARSAAWATAGGYLSLDDEGKPFITLSPDGDPLGAVDAVQSRPVLIEPGGLWAMNTNNAETARRTLFCLRKDATALIVIVHGNGLSLFEAGWVLRGKPWGGFFDCDSAIALDGGGSTQLAVRDNDDLAINGLTRVHNVVAVFAKDSQAEQ